MNFTHLVGNTPMIRIRYKLDGREGFVWASGMVPPSFSMVYFTELTIPSRESVNVPSRSNNIV